MQVVEKSGGGLSRVYGVTVLAAELGEKLEARIKEISPRMNLKGFRPGKVPPAHVKRIYGKALMGEVIEQTLNETSQQVLLDQNLRVAAQPEMEPQSDMEQVLAGGVDLSYDLNVEVMPEFEPVDVTGLKLTRPVYRPTDAEVDEAVTDLAKQSLTYSPKKGKAAKAENGDQLLIDFVGRIDGEAFEGGTAADAELVIGSGQFIPGFEEQLIGASAGKDVTVKVKFPDDYGVETLKGKDAEFAVTVKEVRASEESKVDDALAERLGLTDLEGLKAAIRSNLEGQYTGASRFKIKRALLDELDSHHDFPLPPRMVEAEFVTIWKQVQDDRAAGNLPPEDEGKSDAELETEYRKIAERRVRLGLVLAEVGRRNNVIVTEEELSTAMRQEAMRYGAQAQQIFDLLRQNPNAQAQMRAPIYEEKVVDLILGQAQVKEKAVSKEELMAEDDMPEGYGEPKKAKPKAKAAKKEAAPAKEAEAVEAKAEAPAPKAKPAKAEAPAKPAKAEAAPAKAAKPVKAEAAPAKAQAKPAKAAAPKAAVKAEAPKAAAKAAPAKAAKPRAT